MPLSPAAPDLDPIIRSAHRYHAALPGWQPIQPAGHQAARAFALYVLMLFRSISAR
jgi:hypothetical protein